MKRVMISTLLVLLCFGLSGCPAPPDNDIPEEDPPCPPAPVGQYAKATIQPADLTSIEVYQDTYAYMDPDNDPWCDVGQLDIEGVDVTSLPACPLNKCLVGVNVKPDDVWIDTAQGNPPKLTYDLSLHPYTINPESCVSQLCYAYFRLMPNNTWDYVGSAEAVQASSNPVKWTAEGDIDHLSIYALVELPPSQELEAPRNFGLVVFSPFRANPLGGISVSLLVQRDDTDEVPADQLLIFNFFSVDPTQSVREIREDCANFNALHDQLSCLFPVGTTVEFSIGVDGDSSLYRITAPELDYAFDFFASSVEMHY